MELSELLRTRRMTRSFTTEPVDPAVVDRVLDLGRRVPSAGNTQGFDFLVLDTPDATARYWDATFPASRREGFRWPSLFEAPVLVVVWADPGAYVRRYAEPDKARTGLGAGADRWATPYWTVDASFAALAVQLAAQDAGLGVLFFGMFDHAEAVADEFGVPADREPIGTIALGWPADGGEPGRSQGRSRRSAASLVHRGVW